MGEVFRASDPVLDREVAIKVVATKLTGDEAARRRFVREAKAAAAFNHPNITTVYDFGEHQGMAHLAMEILDEGQDLKDLIGKGALPALEARIAIMEQICATGQGSRALDRRQAVPVSSRRNPSPRWGRRDR
jgi:serine/threonine protein kinase